MTNLTSELVNQIVHEQISKNQKEIMNHITDGTDDTMSTEQVTAYMIANSIRISTQLSVKIVLELLFQSNVVQELDTKTLLKQLSSIQKD